MRPRDDGALVEYDQWHPTCEVIVVWTLAMPSPFPGMNPYFEQPGIWHDFHTEFVCAFRRTFVPNVVPDYYVQLKEQLYIHDLPPDPRRRRVDDLREAPVEVLLPPQDVERIRYLEIRDRAGRDVVTVIELLAPLNKRHGEDRERYLAKRRELFRSPTHFVEIDLLRGGQPMPPDDRPDCDYSVLVSRAERRPSAEVWPIGLRDRLPVIPIPLREGSNDARIDLQEVLDRTYDGPGYEYRIYDTNPEPKLTRDDLLWAQDFLPKSARNREGDPS